MLVKSKVADVESRPYFASIFKEKEKWGELGVLAPNIVLRILSSLSETEERTFSLCGRSFKRLYDGLWMLRVKKDFPKYRMSEGRDYSPCIEYYYCQRASRIRWPTEFMGAIPYHDNWGKQGPPILEMSLVDQIEMTLKARKIQNTYIYIFEKELGPLFSKCQGVSSDGTPFMAFYCNARSLALPFVWKLYPSHQEGVICSDVWMVDEDCDQIEGYPFSHLAQEIFKLAHQQIDLKNQDQVQEIRNRIKSIVLDEEHEFIELVRPSKRVSFSSL